MIRVTAVGDISLGDHYFNLGHGTGSFVEKHGLAKVLAHVSAELSNADIVFGNLETPLRAQSLRVQTSYQDAVFCGTTEMAEQLARAGFNVVNVAGNHILQHGVEVFHDTVNALKSAGISPVGLADASGNCCEPVVKQIRNQKVTILGYSAVNEVHHRSQSLYAQFDRELVRADIARARERSDFVFVSLHFGVEGIAIPSVESRAMARALVEQGADLVLGHHTHVFQPVETYRGRTIVYSMGDFIFDLFWNRQCLESAIVKVEIQQRDLSEVRLVPTAFTRNFEVRAMNDADRATFLHDLNKRGDIVEHASDLEYAEIVAAETRNANRGEPLKKMIYFLSQLPKGDTEKKLRFFASKFGLAS